MDYTNAACGSVEAAPRSEHHAAMLVLEQRSAYLQKSIEGLAQHLDPALRQNGPEPSGAIGANKKDSSSVQIVAHVDAVLSVVESCIQRVESLDARLVI